MSADKVDSESFMLACLKMAKSYIRIVQGELTLYASKPGHVPIETSFQKLSASIEERIKTHAERLEKARAPAKPKVELKSRWVDPATCPQCGGNPVTGHQRLCPVVLKQAGVLKRPKLKKRKV